VLGAAVFQTRIGLGAAFIVAAAVMASLERAPNTAAKHHTNAA
jgi:hypothetical protein